MPRPGLAGAAHRVTGRHRSPYNPFVPTPCIGVILVDHGSQRDESNVMLVQFVTQFRAAGSYDIVEPAHMEITEPSIATAFDRCVAHGATHVVVVPYFLGPGKHWDTDIPNLTAEAAANHEGITYQIAAPLGLHSAMIEIVRDRIAETVMSRKVKSPES